MKINFKIEDDLTIGEFVLYMGVLLILLIVASIILGTSYFIGTGLYYILKYENVSVLLTLIAILATITGILFSASRSAFEEFERKYFYEYAKNLLFCVFLFLIILCILYFYNKFQFTPLLNSEENSRPLIISILIGIIYFVYSLTLLYALFESFRIIYRIILIINPFVDTTKTTINEKNLQYNLKRIKKYFGNFVLHTSKKGELYFYIKKIDIETLKLHDEVKIFRVTLKLVHLLPEFKNILLTYFSSDKFSSDLKFSIQDTNIFFNIADDLVEIQHNINVIAGGFVKCLRQYNDDEPVPFYFPFIYKPFKY